MFRILSLVSAAALALFLAASLWLARLEHGGPPHADVMLEGGVPATMYLPGDARGRGAFLDPPPRAERPPGVVVMHGFASDRVSMSSLSRRLAEAGYAVLAIDVRGHGQNRNPFAWSWAVSDLFEPDLRAAVDFLRVDPFVDGSRVAVLGHSMGASASLDYASRDSGIDAAVMISGGGRLGGPYQPPNALFLYAAADPAPIKSRSRELAARLAGVEGVEPGRSYGRPAHHDAVRVYEVQGADHLSILWKEETVREILAWLDAAFGVARAAGRPPHDPRLAVLVVLGVAFLLVLPGLAQVVGRLVPAAEPRPAGGRALGLLAIAAALALTMPVLTAGVPAAGVGIEIGDVVLSHFALAGIALLVAIRLRRPSLLEGLLERPIPALLGAAVGLIGVFALVQPFGAVVHRVSLTPERSLVFAMAAPGLLPFALAFNLLLRRGPVPGASLAALAGRGLILLALAAGVAAGVLGAVVLLMLPTLALVFLLLEILADSLYAACRNLLAISLVEAAWLALVMAAIMPIRL